MLELVVAGLATYRLTRLIVRDEIFSSLRGSFCTCHEVDLETCKTCRHPMVFFCVLKAAGFVVFC
jgi:hypothetical protein